MCPNIWENPPQLSSASIRCKARVCIRCKRKAIHGRRAACANWPPSDHSGIGLAVCQAGAGNPRSKYVSIDRRWGKPIVRYEAGRNGGLLEEQPSEGTADGFQSDAVATGRSHMVDGSARLRADWHGDVFLAHGRHGAFHMAGPLAGRLLGCYRDGGDLSKKRPRSQSNR
jgi:hypothetical protein